MDSATTQTSRTTRHMLVVDDSRLSRTMIRSLVAARRPDIDCAEAADGEAALAWVTTHPCDLVTLDYNMPGRNGLDVAREMLAARPGLGVVLLSANVQESVRQRATDLGVRFVAKPITAEKIAEVLALAAETP